MIRVGRAPRASRIIRAVVRRYRLPNIEDRSDDFPACLDHIGTLEKRGVADHAVVKQPLVTGADRLAEMIDVIEIHIDRTHLDDRPRDLRTEMERDTFIRLDVNDDAVRAKFFDRSVAKQHQRRLFELNGYARIAG